ncbi:hypothetical protein GF352_00805 [archaeon]|nr:hypothetical protein [archaeon]
MKVDSITVNTPKNAIQYLIGFSIYLLVYGSFEPFKFILGLASFLITYAAIYPYNDLMDYEVDKKDKFKQDYKALVRGDMSEKTAITLAFGLPIIGLLLASLVSFSYTLLLILLLFLNFLYSSPYTRLKDRMGWALVLMFFMQLIKYTIGWFTFTTEVVTLPSWIVLTFTFAYLTSYVLYKKNIINMTKTFKEHKKLMIPLSGITLFSFIISFLVYPYKVPWLLLFPLTFFVLITRKQKNQTTKTFKLMGITTSLMTLIVILFLLLNVPAIGMLNQNASRAIDELGELTLQRMDNGTYELICTINETIFSYPIRDLKDLDNYFNITDLTVVVSNKSNVE